MAIEDTYRQMLIEDFIKQQLEQGVVVSAQDVLDQITILLADRDLSVPQFVVGDFLINRLEESSANKNNNTFLAMRQDLRVLYKNMIELTKLSIESLERWNLESSELEKKLIDLEDRIQNLLILTQDTEGYHSIIVDNLSDTSKVDKEHTTCEVDISTQSAEIKPTAETFQRVFLNSLDPAVDVSFKVRTTVNFLSRNDEVGSTIASPFKQESESWWTNIAMKASGPVTCELNVRLVRTGTVKVNRIVMELHDSSEASPVTITPLWSTDNVTFSQIPSNTFVLEARSNAMFTFPDIEAQWFKFIITKKGPDQSSGTDNFNYQFGFKNIKFYQQGFTADTAQYFVSAPLFVTSAEGEAVQFEKVTLETCERIETGTEVNYYMTFSNDPDVPLLPGSGIQDAALWFPISPVNRTIRPYPTVLDVGDINEIDIGDTEGELVDDEIVKVSYDGRADPLTDPEFINPAKTFNLLSEDIGSGAVVTDSVDASELRYNFVNKNDRILNYQIKTTNYTGSGSGQGLDVNEASLAIFRNVGMKGFDPSDTNAKVRDIQRGWGFTDPYYTCVVEIQNPDGMEIDVGDQPIIIDDVPYTNKVSSLVLTGRTATSTGIHRIKVHKANWKEVEPNSDTLLDLQDEDILYPFNHKLLIEGYDYDDAYPETEEKIYTGVDLFAEFQMRRVSPFDLFYNIPSNEYSVYAMDIDAPSTHDPDNDPTKVFLVKVDDANPDFQNERFVIRFKQINLLQRYLRLRADLITSNGQITPALQSYKIKLG